MKRLAPLGFILLILALLSPNLSGQPGIDQPLSSQGVLTSDELVETANTNLDGTGTLVYLGSLASNSYVDRVMWNSLGTNAVCVGRIFADKNPDLGATVNNVLVVESTLASTTASNTAALAAVTTDINGYYPAGTAFYASVSVDLTSSDGYVAKLYLSGHRRDLEAD